MSVILYEKKNGIGIITLNRPEKRNALNSAMINGLGQYLHEAADDSDVKVIVIRAEGEKAFTAGFDLKESMEHNITDIVERRADTKSEVDFFLYMWYLPKPIISAVQGYCIGGGITIAMMSDLVIAADNASFGNPEIVLGFTPEIPMEHWKLPFNKATEWYFMGKYFSAEEMREMGMVNEVVPYGNLEERVMQVAEQVARIPAERMAMMKHTIRKIYDLRGFANTVEYTSEMFNLSRTNMQQKNMQSFKSDIESGGLKSALNTRYN